MLKQIFVGFCFFTLSAIVCFGQQTFSLTSSPYTQNFDGLANTGTSNPWTDGGTPPSSPGAGWQSNKTIYRADNGTSNAGSLYSYGSANSTERALGSLASGSAGTIIFGVCFTNNTGQTIYRITVNYTGEQWRQTPANNDVLVFEYQIGVNSVTASGTWTNVSALNFNPPQAGPDGALDGNQSANRVSLSQTISPFVVFSGQNFCLRWTDADSTSTDKGMAVDDFSLSFLTTPTAASVSITGRVVNSAGDGVRDAFITLIGGTLLAPIVRRTNLLGYYRFDDIPVGDTYVVTVSSKRYRFSQPSRVIYLQDTITDLDFIAEEP